MDVQFRREIGDVERPEDGLDLLRVRLLQKRGRVGAVRRSRAVGSGTPVRTGRTTRSRASRIAGIVQIAHHSIGLRLHDDIRTVRAQLRVELVAHVEHHAEHSHADGGGQAHGNGDEQTAFELPAERARDHFQEEHGTPLPFSALTGNGSTARRAWTFG